MDEILKTVQHLAPRAIDVNIDGDGILADLYKSIIHTFKPVANNMNIDTMSCLPNPLPPDYNCYQQISKIPCYFSNIFKNIHARSFLYCQS